MPVVVARMTATYLAANGKTLLCAGCNQKAISVNDDYHDICASRVPGAAVMILQLPHVPVPYPWWVYVLGLAGFGVGLVLIMHGRIVSACALAAVGLLAVWVAW